jgi:hypothetical protein
MKLSSTLALVAVLELVSAHTIFTNAVAGGKSYRIIYIPSQFPSQTSVNMFLAIGYAISQPNYDGV